MKRLRKRCNVLPTMFYNIERISAEKITGSLPKNMKYNTAFSVTLVGVEKEKGLFTFDFRVTVTSDPPAVNLSVNGKLRLSFTDEKEKREFIKKNQKEQAAIATNIIFPQIMGTLVILSRELQVPPPLPPLPPPRQERELEFRSM